MAQRDRGVKLIDAIIEGKHDVALSLIKQGADFTIKTKGDYAVHVAARKGWVDIIKAMETKGADISKPNVHGNTVAHYSAKGGFLDIITFLKTKEIDLNVCNEDGFAPLHEAVVHQTMDVIETLVDLGMDPNIQSKVTGGTPLHTAALYGRQPALEGLLIKGASSQIKDNNQKKPQDVAKTAEIRGMIRMYDALKSVINTGYIQSMGIKLTTDLVTTPVVIDRAGVIIESIDIPTEFPTSFYCRREKYENATVQLKKVDEETVFSDVYHLQLTDVNRDCAVKLKIPLYLAPKQKEQMILRFINHEDTDRKIDEFITSNKKHYCLVETTLIPETPCVLVIYVTPKQEDIQVSKQDMVVTSTVEKDFSLAIPANAFGDNTVLSLKVFDAKDDDDEPSESNDEDDTGSSGVKETSLAEKKEALTAVGLVTDVFQISISGEQPKKNLTMQMPMITDSSGSKDFVIIQTDEKTLHDDSLPKVLPLKPKIVNCSLTFEVSHFSIYVALPRELCASEGDLRSIKSGIYNVKERRRPATIFAVVKQIEDHKNSLLVDCGLVKQSQKRHKKWSNEGYKFHEGAESESIMLTPGDHFVIELKGNATFEDNSDASQRKLTFSQCRPSFQAYNISLSRHVRTEKEAFAYVIVSKKVDNSLKEITKLKIIFNVPPPPPKWSTSDPKAFKPVSADKSPYGALRSIFGVNNQPKQPKTGNK